MPKLSEIHPDDLTVESAAPLKLSQIASDEVKPAHDFGEIGPLEAAATAASSGLTYGFDARAIGAMRAVEPGDILPFTEKPEKPFYDRYSQYRDEQKDFLKEAERQHPNITAVADLGGSLVSPLNKITAPVKGAKFLANTARVLGGGAAQAIGQSNSDDLGSLTEEGGWGAATAGALQTAFHGAGKIASKLAPDSLKQFAKERILKAGTGQAQAALEKMGLYGKKGDRIAEDLTNGAEELGIGPSVGLGSKVEDIAKATKEAKNAAWEHVAKTINGIDAKTGGSSITGEEIAAKVRQKIANIDPLPDVNQGVIARLESEAQRLEQEPPMSLARAQDLKGNYEYKFTDPRTHVLGKNGNNAMNTAYSDAISDVVDRVGNKSEKQSFDKGMSFYGSMAEVNKAAAKRSTANVSNRWLSPSDYALGLGGTTIASILSGGDSEDRIDNLPRTAAIGISAALGNKFLRQRGSSIAGVGAKKLGEYIADHPKSIGSIRNAMQKLPYTPASSTATHFIFAPDSE